MQQDKGIIGNYEIPKLNYFSGIYYKRHFGKNAVRLNYTYTQKSLTETYSIDRSVFNSYGTWVTTVTNKNHEIKAGYERSFCEHKLRPYVFTDLVFGYTNMKGQQISRFDGNPAVTTPLYAELFNLGISAGVGFRYYVSKNITISYEGSVMPYLSRLENLYIPKAHRNSFFNASLAYNPVSLLGLSIAF